MQSRLERVERELAALDDARVSVWISGRWTWGFATGGAVLTRARGGKP